MAQDPYTTLGVTRQASAEEIRKAFRTLAKTYHPDRNPDNKKAEERFKVISAAFEIVGDPEKRAKFDRGEIDAAGNERGHGGPFGPGGAARWQNRSGRQSGPQSGFDDVSEIFGDFFGQRAGSRGPKPQKGADVRYRMTVDFLESALGTTKRVALSDGRGIDVTVPQGLRDGQTLRLRGQGQRGTAGGAAGDVFVEISVSPHSFFKIVGDDLSVEVPISLKEAVLGSRIDVPTLDGLVKIKIPPNTSSGVSFRLRGKGLKDPKTGDFGDLFARTRIVLPDQVDPILNAMINDWEAEDRDVRAAFRL